MSRTRGHLDRKTLKQDVLVNFMARATDYVGANTNRVLGIAAGAVVVLIVAILWGRGQTQKGSESDLRLAQVVASFSTGQYEPALELATSLQTSFPGSEAAVLAKFLAGKCQLQLNKFAEAEQSFRAYLESASKAPFYEQAARRAMAGSVEAQGKFADAGKLYQEAAEKLPEPQASAARLDAARALRLAGSADEARKLLQALVADKSASRRMMGNDPKAEISRQAKIELAVLESTSHAPAASPAATP